MLSNTERRIINVIRENQAISRIEIVKKLKLSKPVVSIGVKRLLELGFVKEVEYNHTSKKFGRNRIGLSFIPECMYIIGLDIGGTKLKAIIGDLDGNIVRSVKFATKGINSKKLLIELIYDAIYKLKDGFGKTIIGIGIGIPGTLDVNRRIAKYMPAFDLRDVNLKEPLEKEFNLPIFIENDVTLDAYAEIRIGAGKEFKNLLLVSIGTGIGAGIVIDKKIYSGSTGKAGEIGNMVTDWGKEKRFIKNAFGPLENWFSGASLERKLIKLGIDNLEKGFRIMEKSEEIGNIIKEGIYHTGIAISNTILILNPEAVILKGGIGYNQYDKIMSYMMPLIKEIIPIEILENTQFKKGKIKEFGVAVGALFFTQNSILKI